MPKTARIARLDHADRVGLTRRWRVPASAARRTTRGLLRDLRVMLADGGDCLGDLGALRDQVDLFGLVASDSKAFRVIDHVDEACLERLRAPASLPRCPPG